MKFEKVIFYELFPTSSFANQRLGVEVALDDGDSPLVAFERARDMVREAFNKLNPPLEETPSWAASSSYVIGQVDYNKATPLTGQQTAPPIRNLAAERDLMDKIEKATTADELDALYDEAEKYFITSLWDKKLKSLQ